MPTTTARYFKQQGTRCGASTRDHRREATLLLLLLHSPVLRLLWFGHTHAHKNCYASDLWVEGIHTYHVEEHTKQPRLRSKQALTSTVVSQ